MIRIMNIHVAQESDLEQCVETQVGIKRECYIRYVAQVLWAARCQLKALGH